MHDQIKVETSEITPGYVRVAACGVAGIGSKGNRHGEQILLLVFVVAGAFVGFRFGLSEGVDVQVERRLADEKNIQMGVAYEISFVQPKDGVPASIAEQFVTELRSSVCRPVCRRHF